MGLEVVDLEFGIVGLLGWVIWGLGILGVVVWVYRFAMHLLVLSSTQCVLHCFPIATEDTIDYSMCILCTTSTWELRGAFVVCGSILVVPRCVCVRGVKWLVLRYIVCVASNC